MGEQIRRPNLEIMRLKGSVAASRGASMDADTDEFMAGLEAVMNWLDHLEALRLVPDPPKP